MQVYMAGQTPNLTQKPIGVVQLQSEVMDSEATEIVLDNLLCEFSTSEQKTLMELVTKKCRIGATVTIIEKDFNIIANNFAIGTTSIEDINKLFAGGRGRKSLMNEPMICKLIPSNFKITNKNFDKDSTITVKARREA